VQPRRITPVITERGTRRRTAQGLTVLAGLVAAGRGERLAVLARDLVAPWSEGRAGRRPRRQRLAVLARGITPGRLAGRAPTGRSLAALHRPRANRPGSARPGLSWLACSLLACSRLARAGLTW
jgi:hypothetical protein